MNSNRKIMQLTRNWVTAFVDPRRVIGIMNLPRYLVDWRRYNRLAGIQKLNWQDSFPSLTDWTSLTPFDAHYFYQAAWIARRLTCTKPLWHVDIGSSVMMIGVTSAIAPTTFVDYRPFRAQLAGLQSLAGDLMTLPFADDSVPSLSCLHVIEHVGLGRYGDKLNPQGSYEAGCELARILGRGGRLFLSTPVGRERVQFNAHRVFAPETVVAMFKDLELVDYALVDDQGRFRDHQYPISMHSFNGEYGCGMFEFVKK